MIRRQASRTTKKLRVRICFVVFLNDIFLPMRTHFHFITFLIENFVCTFAFLHFKLHRNYIFERQFFRLACVCIPVGPSHHLPTFSKCFRNTFSKRKRKNLWNEIQRVKISNLITNSFNHL